MHIKILVCIVILRCLQKQSSGGKDKIIKVGSQTKKDIADLVENGISLWNVTGILNKWLLQNVGGDLDSAVWFTKSAVESAMNQMTKVELPVKRGVQGDFDKSSNWAEASHRFVMQLQVCISDNADWIKFIDNDGNLPDCFNKDKLHPISFKGTLWWWDKAHHDCHLGYGGNKDSKQFKFPRYELGVHDKKGEISNKTAFYC